MKKTFTGKRSRFLIWALILIVVTTAVSLVAIYSYSSKASATTGPTDQCGPIEPSDQEVKYALSFESGLFTSNDWVKSYTVEPHKISITRNNDTESAIAYTEYLIFNCGYSQQDLNSYFNTDNFNVVFGGYESHTLSKFCEMKKLSLYQYDLILKGMPYSARYWVKQDDSKHIFVMMLVLPKTSPDKLDRYSKQIFPQYSSCT
jgi:hypothetical protein